jgi:putative ATP-binding cassette transporter
MRGLGPFLRDAWRLARPYFVSEERRAAWALLISLIALSLLIVAINVQLSYWGRAFYNTLQDKDWDGFIGLILFWHTGKEGGAPGFTLLAGIYVLTSIYRTYLNQWLTIRWRRWLTERFLSDWLSGQTYWRIFLAADNANSYGTDNPDQRIADDVNNFVSNTIDLTLGLLSSIVTLVSFVAILWTLSGPVTLLGVTIPGYMVWVALLYAAVGTALTHLVGRPLAALNFRQQRVEADFRFGLARIRENVEGIALYGGEAQEHHAASERFRAVIANWWQIMQRTKLLNSVIAGFDQIAVIFPLIIAAPRYFAGEIPLGAMTQTSGAFRSVEGALAWFVHAYQSLAEWRAVVDRLAAFHHAMREASEAAPGVTLRESAGDRTELDALSLRLPDGRTLLQPSSLSLPPGQDVVVGGPSGTGKSTLFRALAGLWPFGSGNVNRARGTHLFLPQRPYIPLGTLRRAVVYPGAVDAHTDTEIQDALTAVGLAQLLPRLDAEEPWGQRLSGGEQQRLAFARALLAKPDFLYLDEATASLDPESEAKLYALLKTRLPNTTLLSVAHRPAVAAFHDRRLRFANATLNDAPLADAA